MKKGLKAILFMWGSFAVAVIICVILSINTDGIRLSNTLINIGFFVFAFLIFLYATTKFIKLKRITKDIFDAIQTINNDFHQNGNVYLWEKYKARGFLFNTKELSEIYSNYVNENNRLNDTGVYEDIENYINYKVIDSYTKKSVLNLIAGSMTGLGILGTFIGLSIGLRSFSTGTAEEISNSISPLMDGIKVAFHTSIYGMLLSLLFNFGYKGDLEYAYDLIDEFVDTFKAKVVPNPESESVKLVVQYQKQQADNMANLATAIGEKIAEKMGEIITPQLDKMNATIEIFANNAGKVQVEGVNSIVNSFVEEMHKSLGDSFKDLSVVIKDTCDWQRQNASLMQDILQRVSDMTTNIREINEMSEKTISSMSSYVSHIDELQNIINDNLYKVNSQIEAYGDINDKQASYIEKLVNYEQAITEASKTFSADMAKQIEILNNMEEQITNNTMTSIEALTKKAEESSVAISEAAKRQIESIINVSNSATGDMDSAAKELARVSAQLNGQLNQALTDTFNTFDNELTTISNHLSATISRVDSTVERVPNVVMAAYDGMHKSFDEMQNNIEKLVHSIDNLRRKIDAQIKIYED